VRAGIGSSIRPEGAGGVEEAVEAALAGLGGAPPDAVIVAGTTALGSRALPDLIARVGAGLDCEAWIAASAEGLLLADREIVRLPGFAVVAVSGIRAEPFSCENLAGREAEAAAEIAGQLSGSPEAGDLLVVFIDSVGLALGPLIPALAQVAGPARIMGLGASEMPGGAPQIWGAGDFVEKGCAGLWIRAPRSPAIAVTDGSRAVGEEMEITRVRGHWVLGLDGCPALARLRDAAGALEPGALTRSVLARLRAPGAGDAPGSAVVRNLTGIDPDREGFALPVAPSKGDGLCFVRMDSVAAREDLGASLAKLGPGQAGLGLYFSCRSRGEKLFQHAGLESGYLATTLGGAPLLGMMGAFQLAPDPMEGVPLFHTYSGVFARFER
jgi:small ligand-binding sensory domain FIST